MWLILLKNNWKELILLVLVSLLVWKIYDVGHDNGRDEIQLKWDKEKVNTQAKINELKEANRKLEADHRLETGKITNELSEAKREHQVALADQRTEFERRLRLSEGRAATYRRMSEAGPAQCSRLASHATELDGSLEQGRNLVIQLRETLGLREREIRSLSNQIITDRKLINGSE